MSLNRANKENGMRLYDWKQYLQICSKLWMFLCLPQSGEDKCGWKRSGQGMCKGQHSNCRAFVPQLYT